MYPLWLALTLAVAGAADSGEPAPGTRAGAQVRVVVEPGKPMQYEVVEPEPEQKKVEPCALASVRSRQGTPSSACLACHDGSRAPEVPDARSGHAYDVTYDPYLKPNLRKSPEQWNRAVVLVEGKVTCLTCHNPASTELYHLVGPVDGPVEKRFCVACHPRE